MTSRKNSPPLGAILELPLALLSFLVYRVARKTFKTLAKLQMWRRPDIATNWRVVSGPALTRPLVLPLVMTTGPRWNTHAVIGTVGPLQVNDRLSFDGDVVARSAGSWTAVINQYPSYATVTRLGGGDGIPGKSEIELAPGRYSVIFRYYLLRGAPVFPALSVDGRPAISEASFPEGINRFYDGFGARSRPIYFFLHFYVTTLLKLRGWVSESLIARELLPVGNPETGFLYDAFRAAQRIRFSVDAPLLETHLVLYTMYGRDSFPFHSARITEVEHESPAALRDGFFLLRLHPLVPTEDPSTALAGVRAALV